MRLRYLLLAFLLSFPATLFAQKNTVRVKGMVLSKNNLDTLTATIEITDKSNRSVKQIVISDSINGFEVNLALNKSYEFFVTTSEKEYLRYSQVLTIDKPDIYLVNFELVKIDVSGGPSIIYNIYFNKMDTSIFAIEKNTKKIALNVNLFNYYLKMTFEIVGHCDSIEFLEAKEDVGLLRAQNVFTFLVKNGIDANRLVVSSRNKTKPLASNTTEEGRALNRRVDFLVIKQ
jgi:outer membrane protein OmpA-like peptidoglycan-associated protein